MHMKTDVIDDNKQLNLRSNPFQWIVVGIFVILCAQTFRHTLSMILTDLLVATGAEQLIVYWGIEGGAFLLTIIFVLFVIKWQKNIMERSNHPVRISITGVVITYIVLNGLQFMYSFFSFDLYSSEHLDNLSQYYSLNTEIAFLSSWVYLFRSEAIVVITAVLFYRTKSIQK
jgi:hypothetical protein